MTMDLSRLTQRSFLYFLLILVVFFLATGSFLAYQQNELMKNRAIADREHDLNMMAGLIVEPLTKSDYLTVETFLERWGIGRSDVVSIRLVSGNDFVLASYTRFYDSRHPIPLQKIIDYGMGNKAILNLIMDGDPMHQGFIEFIVMVDIDKTFNTAGSK